MSAKACLMVIDVQREYMEDDPFQTIDGDDLIAKCRSLLDRARAADLAVVYVQHLADPPPEDPAMAEICPEIAPQDGEPVVQKHFGSAFLKTELKQVLAEREIGKLYICGLATHGCVNETIKSAICLEYDVVVASDAHGARTVEEASPAEVVKAYNEFWQRIGAQLAPTADLPF